MEKDLVGGNVGSVGKYDLAFHNGELVITGSAQEGPFRQKLELAVGADGIFDALEAKYPILKPLCEAARSALKS